MHILGLGRYLGDGHDGVRGGEMLGQPPLRRHLLHALGVTAPGLDRA